MLATAIALLAQAPSGPPTEQAIEFGTVHWERDYAVARTRAQRESKALFTLFQEVPG